MFANRRTGGITIAQWPNVALSVFIALSIARRFMFQRGTSETTLRVLSAVVLIVWAVDEFAYGAAELSDGSVPCRHLYAGGDGGIVPFVAFRGW